VTERKYTYKKAKTPAPECFTGLPSRKLKISMLCHPFELKVKFHFHKCKYGTVLIIHLFLTLVVGWLLALQKICPQSNPKHPNK
jgi:hypothetical protein